MGKLEDADLFGEVVEDEIFKGNFNVDPLLIAERGPNMVGLGNNLSRWVQNTLSFVRINV